VKGCGRPVTEPSAQSYGVARVRVDGEDQAEAGNEGAEALVGDPEVAVWFHHHVAWNVSPETIVVWARKGSMRTPMPGNTQRPRERGSKPAPTVAGQRRPRFRSC